MLQATKSIHEREASVLLEPYSMVTDVSMFETNTMVYKCFELLEKNRDKLLEKDAENNAIGYGISYYSYIKCTRDVIDVLDYTGWWSLDHTSRHSFLGELYFEAC